jgi:hypothetical protein
MSVITLEQRFWPYLVRYNIDLRYGLDSRLRRSDSCLTIYPDRCVLSIHESIDGPYAVDEVAIQLAYLLQGHAFKRHRRTGEIRDVRLHRRMMVLAAEIAMPDKLMRQAQREQWEPWQVAEASGATMRLVFLRFECWQRSKGKVVTLFLR